MKQLRDKCANRKGKHEEDATDDEGGGSVSGATMQVEASLEVEKVNIKTKQGSQEVEEDEQVKGGKQRNSQ